MPLTTQKEKKIIYHENIKIGIRSERKAKYTTSIMKSKQGIRNQTSKNTLNDHEKSKSGIMKQNKNKSIKFIIKI